MAEKLTKYLRTNCYKLNPKYAKFITSQIAGDELKDLGVELSIETGCINGIVDEYDEQYTIKDTITIKLNEQILGKLVINGTELSIAPKYSYTEEEFIQVSFLTMLDHPFTNYFLNGKQWVTQNGIGEKCFTNYFLNGKQWVTQNGIGEKCYNFLVLHKSDLEQAKTIILNKLREEIERGQKTLISEERLYINSIRNEYTKYIK